MAASLGEANPDSSSSRSWEGAGVLDPPGPTQIPLRVGESRGRRGGATCLGLRDLGRHRGRPDSLSAALPGDAGPFVHLSFRPLQLLISENHEHSSSSAWEKQGHPFFRLHFQLLLLVETLGFCPIEPSRTWVSRNQTVIPWNCTLGRLDPDIFPCLSCSVSGRKVWES